MTFLHTIIFGIVEGITEFLPVSSTAHLEVTQALLRIPSTDFIKSFEIAIQLGAILAVAVLYIRKIFSSRAYFWSVAVAFIPTGIIGFLLYKIIKNFFLGNIALAAVMLLLGGIFIVFYERREKRKEKLERKNETAGETRPLSIRESLIVGTAQALAVIPGVSRSATVILSGRMMGLSRLSITEFSFLLAIPTMLAATLYDLYKSGFGFSTGDWRTLGLGFVVSFIVALAAVRWLLGYVKRHSFEAFGWYRIALGAVILIFALANPANAYTYTGVLKLGSTGSSVTSLQARLGVPETGEFDYATRAAVVNFQYSYGLTADGVVGTATADALSRAASNPGPSGLSSAPAPVPEATGPFPPGCTAGTFYSATTGVSCDMDPVYPAGCTSTDGFSATTGLSCALPIGCTADTRYSAFTGELCRDENISSSNSSGNTRRERNGTSGVFYY